MKLRFRQNSLRLRVNRREVDTLASGQAIREVVRFPNRARFTYVFESFGNGEPQASFEDGEMRVAAPLSDIQNWARSEAIGLYFDFQAECMTLSVAIEKDLECLDGPPEEQDPDAFPREDGGC
ncbi:MAG: hypothetical protein M3Y24_09480 [Acidobacteriota bacterium]|nr:hypothetical protein [Acidobacteriota bacterium]